jgi:hypothetical protein
MDMVEQTENVHLMDIDASLLFDRCYRPPAYLSSGPRVLRLFDSHGDRYVANLGRGFDTFIRVVGIVAVGKRVFPLHIAVI